MATTKNLFALLESDDEDAPKVQTTVTKKAEATKPTKAVKTVNNAPKDVKEAVKKSNSAVTARDAEQEKRSDKRPSRGGRGGRGGRGRGGDRREGRREFDRRSGTGRGREAAKGGSGGHNWGADKDEKETAVAVAEEPKESSEEETAPTPVEEVVEEEEDNEMTLDEYMAKREAEKRSGKAFEQIEVRAVTNEFKSSLLVSKEKTPDFIEADHERVYRAKTSGRKKQVFEDVGFRAPQTDRRNYDDNRRGGRRGNNRNPRVHVPNVGDAAAFPSLS